MWAALVEGIAWSLPVWGVCALLIWQARRWERADTARAQRFHVRVVAWVDQQRADLRALEAAGVDRDALAGGHALLDCLEAPPPA